MSVQIWEKALDDVPDLEDQIGRGEFGALRGWLGEHVHAHGRKFSPQETLERASGSRIDASGALSDGTNFEGMPGLKKMLLDHSDEFVATVAEKLLMYAAGRNLQYYDAPAVRQIVRGAAASKYSFSALVLGVVRSVPFQMRRVGENLK